MYKNLDYRESKFVHDIQYLTPNNLNFCKRLVVAGKKLTMFKCWRTTHADGQKHRNRLNERLGVHLAPMLIRFSIGNKIKKKYLMRKKSASHNPRILLTTWCLVSDTQSSLSFRPGNFLKRSENTCSSLRVFIAFGFSFTRTCDIMLFYGKWQLNQCTGTCRIYVVKCWTSLNKTYWNPEDTQFNQW